ncbi:hypothetical protein [Pedobacter sp. Hv1]|uniref:hypothetical protein n=1 Tax=Pedobacter sp. Hv1 TaxID=1740090 RepID=UPI0006D89041|nr:hypothetical protein [Pedobacter sp. Hv1]KQB99894.1 hypothetical protein AQF98_15380 [Pedobacter sp. Hv1]
MEIKKIKDQTFGFLKEIYSVWFPWLDIAVLAFIYFFLWGEHINPYRQYQLIKHGEIAIGQISGESGLYANSDAPRMRDFDYTFTLPNGKTIKSSSHTFNIKEVDGKQRKFPVSAEISYLTNQPEINWVKSNLPHSIGNLAKRNLIFGLLFILMSYLISTIVFRLSILDYRAEKQERLLAKEERILIQLPKEQLN